MFSMIPYRTHSFNRMPATREFLNPFSDDFFRAFFGDERLSGSFKVDVKDEGDHYLLEADLPGVSKDDLHIDVENGVMTISAEMNEAREETRDNYVYRERRCGTMRRAFNLEGVNEDAITAAYTDGVLQLNLPKLAEEPEPAARRIEIN